MLTMLYKHVYLYQVYCFVDSKVIINMGLIHIIL